MNGWRTLVFLRTDPATAGKDDPAREAVLKEPARLGLDRNLHHVFAKMRKAFGDVGARARTQANEDWLFEEFCSVLCENYGVWRWSILLRFWRILGVLVGEMFI